MKLVDKKKVSGDLWIRWNLNGGSWWIVYCRNVTLIAGGQWKDDTETAGGQWKDVTGTGG